MGATVTILADPTTFRTDGTYLIERKVTGVQRGAFNVTATVTWKETCERGAQSYGYDSFH